MARLYTGPLSSAAEPQPEEDLPGLSDLPAAQLVKLGLAQADVALTRLKAFLDDAPLPATDAVRAETEKSPPDRDGIRQALVHHLEPHRALVLLAWLDDLKTVLPAHAGQGVADSLRCWERWAQAAGLAMADPATVNSTARQLHRCGQTWRAILSGEKAATDVLETSDYVTAARGTLARAAAIAWALALRLWAPPAVAAVLIGVGIWLIIVNHSTAQVLAGLGTIAGGLGITWRSAAGSVKHLSLDLVQPLWEAQIDDVVAARLTPAPQRDYRPAFQRPHGRWRRAWHELRTADPPPAGTTPAQPDPGQPAPPQST